MRSFLAALRTLVLPYGRTSGKRTVLNATDGEIDVYDENNNLVGIMSSDGFIAQFGEAKAQMGVYSDGTPFVRVLSPDGKWEVTVPTLSPNDPRMTFSESTTTPGVYDETVSIRWSKTAQKLINLITQNGNQSVVFYQGVDVAAIADNVGGTGLVFDRASKYIYRGDINTSSYTLETWNTLPLEAGFTPRGPLFFSPAYRLLPDGQIGLSGAISGTFTPDATVFATLPAEYRPSKRCSPSPATYSGGRIEIEPDGTMRAYGITDGNIDLTGCSFPLDR